MEFKEFMNPESRDYDIKSSLGDESNNRLGNPYSEQLCNMIGILEDITDEELQEQYGISMDEYLNPTVETIEKVSERIAGRPR